MSAPRRWAGLEGPLGVYVDRESHRWLEAYRSQPRLVNEHANIERAVAEGGYGRRQLYELVQNGADAVLEAGSAGRITVVLTGEALYCANEGAPIDESGVDALLSSHVSAKRVDAIGRFGLGFKSVLGVSETPMLYSSSVSFCFDAARSHREISRIVPAAERYPVLRFAHVLDPHQAAEDDATLADLMSWATTVVKLPLKPGSGTWLSEDLAAFPAEFLIFSPHIARLELDDRTANAPSRRLSATSLAPTHVELDIDGEHQQWRVFECQHKLSPDARDQAGLADRESVPLIWAAPLRRTRDRGQFWAFFPTETPSVTAGIINAPWKTNEDRQHLLAGAFNDELLSVAADLISEHVSELSTPEDPGRHLEYLPPVKVSPAQPDAFLADHIYERLKDCPIIPDQDGRLRRSASMRIVDFQTPQAAQAQWAACVDRPRHWAHHSLLTRSRHSRASRLFVGEATLADWVADLAARATVETSSAAILIVTELRDDPDVARRPVDEAAVAPIVLTTDGTLKSMKDRLLVLAPDEVTVPPDFVKVHEGLFAQEPVRNALQSFNVAKLLDENIFSALVSQIRAGKNIDWSTFWSAAAAFGENLVEYLEANGVEKNALCVRTAAGGWRDRHSVLREGRVITAIDDPYQCVDPSFEHSHHAVLTWLQIRTEPYPHAEQVRGQPWFGDYLMAARKAYDRQYAGLKSRPQQRRLNFDGTNEYEPGPTVLLDRLSGTAKARYTVALLELARCSARWRLRHDTQHHYPDLDFESPVWWLCREKGLLETSNGPRPVTECLGPGLTRLSAVAPVAECDADLADDLALPDTVDKLSRHAIGVILEAVRSLTDPVTVGEVYAALCPHVVAPKRLALPSADGVISLAPAEATATHSQAIYELLLAKGQPALLAPTSRDVEALAAHWGLQLSDLAVNLEIHRVGEAAPVLLADEFPALRRLLDEHTDIALVRCENLYIDYVEGGQTRTESPEIIVDNQTVFARNVLTDTRLITRLGEHFEWDIAEDELEALARSSVDDSCAQARAQVAAEPSVPRRAVAAIGEDVLLERLPAELTSAVTPGDPAALGRLALAVHGVELLHDYRHALEDRGLVPPRRWRGGRHERAFVTELGFDASFAGFAEGQLDDEFTVRGRPSLAPLHDFQERISAELALLLDGDSDGTRGLVALPTGAGKTRVAVQALVETLRHRAPPARVLWVAQTEELCEQAVQTFKQIWRAVGPDEPLTIARLWSTNHAVASEHHQVVVATISKLNSIVQRASGRYAWLGSNLLALVVDEAHGSTTKSYTGVLRFLGYPIRGEQQDPAPMVGLTATPFRGLSREETARLASRYHHRRLDAAFFGTDNPYLVLQQRGVLAEVEQEVLDGVDIDASDEEIASFNASFKMMGRLPPAVESRIGANSRRNRQILACIERWPDDWPVLIFAASVDHAKVLAGQLQLRGISAAPIWGETRTGARRHYVEQFRAGKLRVLTNYNVLAEGFDAPAIRAIIMARPTFSANRYQQMVGRGLRGPSNGGKPTCLIVNIADNVSRFGQELAFRDFEYLWRHTRSA